MNRTRINSSQSIFFWNITSRQAVSTHAKFYHVLRRGFMIQRVILIALVAECEANQHNPGLECSFDAVWQTKRVCFAVYMQSVVITQVYIHIHYIIRDRYSTRNVNLYISILSYCACILRYRAFIYPIKSCVYPIRFCVYPITKTVYQVLRLLCIRFCVYQVNIYIYMIFDI